MDTVQIYAFGAGKSEPKLQETLVGYRSLKQFSCGLSQTWSVLRNGECHYWRNVSVGDSVISSDSRVRRFEGQMMTQVACCSTATCFLTDDGTAVLRTVHSAADYDPSRGEYETVALPEPVKEVACADTHLLLLCKSGKLYYKGLEKAKSKNVELVELDASIGEVLHVYAAPSYSALLTEKGELFTWGKGPLGLGLRNDCDKPTLVETLKEKHIKHVSCGLFHMAAVTAKGELYTWGSSVWHQLGHGEHMKYLPLPKRVAALEGKGVVDCSCGAYHTACITELGHLYTWGANNNGALGLNDFTDREVPHFVEELEGQFCWTVRCGWYHTIVAVRKEVNINTFRLAEDFGQLLFDADNPTAVVHNSLFPDIFISAHDELAKPIACHRLFLSARCKRLATEIEAIVSPTGGEDGKEKETQGDHPHLVLKDISSRSLLELLRWIYTGKIYPIMTTEDLVELIFATKHYDLPILRLICYETFAANLSPETVCDEWLALHGVVPEMKVDIERLEDEEVERQVVQMVLKDLCRNFICKSFDIVKVQPSFDKIAAEFAAYDKRVTEYLNQRKSRPQQSSIFGMHEEEPRRSSRSSAEKGIFDNERRKAKTEEKAAAATAIAATTEKEKPTAEQRNNQPEVNDEKQHVVEVKFDTTAVASNNLSMSGESETDKQTPAGEEWERKLQAVINERSHLHNRLIGLVREESIKAQLRVLIALNDKEMARTVSSNQIKILPWKLHGVVISAEPRPVDTDTLAADVIKYLGDKRYSDLELHVEDQVIPIHKVVLCSRASHFRAMFSSGMLESSKGVIEIHDISYASVMAMFKFLYSGVLEIDEEHCVELLMAANQYTLLQLQELCEAYIEKGICEDNAADIFEMAYRYQTHHLKNIVLAYLLDRRNTIVQQPSFMDLPEELKEEVFRHVTSPAHCKVKGKASRWAEPGKAECFGIVARNSKGQRTMKGGDTFEVQIVREDFDLARSLSGGQNHSFNLDILEEEESRYDYAKPRRPHAVEYLMPEELKGSDASQIKTMVIAASRFGECAGVYHVKYIPKEAGIYLIHITMDGQKVADSPYRLIVGHRYWVSHECSIYGDGLTHATANTTNTIHFKIDNMEKYKDHLQWPGKTKRPITVSVSRDINDNNMDSAIYDGKKVLQLKEASEDGVFKIDYKLPPGRHDIQVNVHTPLGKHLMATHYVHCDGVAKAAPESTQLEGPGLTTARIGKANDFTISLFDKENRPVTVRLKDLKVTVQEEKSEGAIIEGGNVSEEKKQRKKVRVKIMRGNSPEKYHVSYYLIIDEEEGKQHEGEQEPKWKIMIELYGVPLPQCPFIVSEVARRKREPDEPNTDDTHPFSSDEEGEEAEDPFLQQQQQPVDASSASAFFAALQQTPSSFPTFQPSTELPSFLQPTAATLVGGEKEEKKEEPSSTSSPAFSFGDLLDEFAGQSAGGSGATTAKSKGASRRRGAKKTTTTTTTSTTTPTTSAFTPMPTTFSFAAASETLPQFSFGIVTPPSFGDASPGPTPPGDTRPVAPLFSMSFNN